MKHKIHNTIGKHAFAKNWVQFDLSRMVNNCPNPILDQINTQRLLGFSGNIKKTLFAMLIGKLHYDGILCMQ